MNRRILGALVMLAACTWTSPALACGGFFCMNQPIDQSGERILFIQDGWDVVAHVQIAYQGDARKFSWVVPTPTAPKLGVGSDALFAALDLATKPHFQLDLQTLGDCPPPPSEMFDDREASSSVKKEDGVQVVSQERVGPYDTAVIQSNDPGALRAWLRSNGYTLPPKLDPLLDPYVAGKYYFVALKLQQDRQAGDLQPISMRYQAVKPGIPIRLTAVAAVPDMDVTVWVLSEDRAIPENFRHAEINEARIDWLNAGSNYKAVVTEAVNEAGGQAFVTDFAGDDKGVDMTTFEGKNQDLVKLAGLTDPVAFLLAIQTDGYFQRGSANALAFVRRYVPIPKALKDVWEPGFYSNPTQYREQLAALGIQVDARKAARELEETVVRPSREIARQFSRHTYLTRLYTTLSPEEMTQDPTFRSAPAMGTVSNVRRAQGVRDCRKVKDYFSAPVTITLGDGTRFTVRPNEQGVASPLPLPAAKRVEQLKAVGAPSVIEDNRARIAEALRRRRPGGDEPEIGAGCARTTTQPASGGHVDGGFGLAALLVGFWGLRRRRRP